MKTLTAAGEWMVRHAGAVFQQLDERYVQSKKQFEAVDALTFHPTFDQACLVLKSTLNAMLQTQAQHHDENLSAGADEEANITATRGL